MGRNKETADNSDKDLLKRVELLEQAVKALLKSMVDVEKEIDEAVMPEGTFYGIEFKD